MNYLLNTKLKMMIGNKIMNIEFPTAEDCKKDMHGWGIYCESKDSKEVEDALEWQRKRMTEYRYCMLNANIRFHFLFSQKPYIISPKTDKSDIFFLFGQKYKEKTIKILEDNGFVVITESEEIIININ